MQPTLTRPPLIATFIAAILATLIAIALLAGVTTLLLRNGMPLEEFVAAEHA